MVNIENEALRDAMVNAGAEHIVGLSAHSDAYQCIRAALAAAEAVGWALVPIEPTQEMVKAVETGSPYMSIRQGWRQMVEARPKSADAA